MMKALLQRMDAWFHHPGAGLLVMRLCLGIILVIAGWEKLTGGLRGLHDLGKAVEAVGLSLGGNRILAVGFGAAAALSEFVGGLLLVVGLWVRPALVFLIATMAVATVVKFQGTGGDLKEFGYPLVVLMTLIGLMLTGPGRFRLGRGNG